MNERRRSASGGIAYALMEEMLNEEAYIYGAAFDETGCLRFQEAASPEEISYFRGSKYVQAKTGDIYRKVKQRLDEGKKVLFIGLPCQIAGLRAYLQKDYENLYTVDLLCHGVPSQRYLQKHLEYIYAKKPFIRRRVKTMRFRKQDSYSLRLLNEKNKTLYVGDEYEDEYVVGFVHGLTYRESCYSCAFAGINRSGDITLGDFWGLGKYGQPFEHLTEDGVSLILVNTDKGRKLLNRIENKCCLEERTLKEAMQEQTTLKLPSKRHEGQSSFLRDYLSSEKSFERCVRDNMPLEYGMRYIRENKIFRRKKYIKGLIKRIVGKRMVFMIGKIRRRLR